jgi:hypothetical protein
MSTTRCPQRRRAHWSKQSAGCGLGIGAKKQGRVAPDTLHMDAQVVQHSAIRVWSKLVCRMRWGGLLATRCNACGAHLCPSRHHSIMPAQAVSFFTLILHISQGKTGLFHQQHAPRIMTCSSTDLPSCPTPHKAAARAATQQPPSAQLAYCPAAAPTATANTLVTCMCRGWQTAVVTRSCSALLCAKTLSAPLCC